MSAYEMHAAVSIAPGGMASARERIQDFVATPCFRSATVEELVLRDNFCRRPLRPEDFPHLDLSAPLGRGDACSLAALSANRALWCVNDTARTEPNRDVRVCGESAQQFYSAATVGHGEAVRGFLEELLFAHCSLGAGQTTLAERAQGLKWAMQGRHGALVDLAVASRAVQALYTLQLLAPCWAIGDAVAHAEQRGALVGSRGSEVLAPLCERLVESVCDLGITAVLNSLQLSAQAHAHWQFYLPTSMSIANYLHRVASGPHGASEFGAALGTWAMDLATWWECMTPVLALRPEPGVALAEVAGDLLDAAARSGDAAGGGASLHQFGGLLDARDADLWHQSVWVAQMDAHLRFAERVAEKIERERPDIDRDTFVEPRDMCSTTHVHDDHRLVVIEQGVMVFWAAPGMRLVLNPGEAAFVPAGRLHGSSVLTPECIYHQPVLPDSWVSELLLAPSWCRH